MFVHSMGVCAWMGGMLLAAPAFAASTVRASIVWHGQCEDRAALADEARARGAEVEFVEGSDAAVSLRAEVSVAAHELLARVELESAGARAARELTARDCAELRRAIAWVLVVFAEERAAEFAANSASESAAPEPAKLPEDAAAAAPRHGDVAPAAVPARSRVCARSPWHAGARLTAGAGFVPSVTLGPSAFGRYRPCSAWFAGIELSALYLTTLGYERGARSLTVRRVAGRGAGWFALGVEWLEAGAALELGQLSASSSTTTEGRGSDDAARWLALGIPLAARRAVIVETLWVEAGAEALYVPATYSLRYASGEALNQTSHFEVRASLGLELRF